mmetsp:Transcript_5868/g.9483  ORF Transcript_5868/g.9483 Transcript_5868/m.9483 type:complete len:296 (-) Transcript_5868:804-1691(-)
MLDLLWEPVEISRVCRFRLCLFLEDVFCFRGLGGVTARVMRLVRPRFQISCSTIRFILAKFLQLLLPEPFMRKMVGFICEELRRSNRGLRSQPVFFDSWLMAKGSFKIIKVLHFMLLLVDVVTVLNDPLILNLFFSSKLRLVFGKILQEGVLTFHNLPLVFQQVLVHLGLIGVASGVETLPNADSWALFLLQGQVLRFGFFQPIVDLGYLHFQLNSIMCYFFKAFILIQDLLHPFQEDEASKETCWYFLVLLLMIKELHCLNELKHIFMIEQRLAFVLQIGLEGPQACLNPVLCL